MSAAPHRILRSGCLSVRCLRGVGLRLPGRARAPRLPAILPSQGRVEETVSKQKKLTPHQKIIRAAERGVGVRLDAEEVSQLAFDQAILQCAENDDDPEFCEDARISARKP